jgi:hypothetical protein
MRLAAGPTRAADKSDYPFSEEPNDVDGSNVAIVFAL